MESEITTHIMTILQGTPLGSKFVDLATVKRNISPMIAATMEKLDKKDTTKILAFIKNTAVLQRCIIPGVVQIISDGKLGLDDISSFLNILVGVYENISEFIQANGITIISANDIVELSGLLVKIVFAMVVQDPAQLAIGASLVDITIKMVNMTVKTQSCSKLNCCCKK
jgi:hypothetical protein